MDTEPTTPAIWLKLTHEVRAEVSGPITAQTIAIFTTLIPDQAEISMAAYHPQKQVATLVAHWPHEAADDAVHAPTCLQHTHTGFDIGQDIAANPDAYALGAAQQLEGCAARWNDRPCTREAGHADTGRSPHVYAASAAGGDLYPNGGSLDKNGIGA